MLQPCTKSAWESGPDDRICRTLYVIVGTDVLVFPCLRIDDPETDLRVSIAGLAHTPHIDEKLDPMVKCKCLPITPPPLVLFSLTECQEVVYYSRPTE